MKYVAVLILVKLSTSSGYQMALARFLAGGLPYQARERV